MAHTADFTALPDPSDLDAGSTGTSVTEGVAAVAQTLNAAHRYSAPTIPGQRFAGNSVTHTSATARDVWTVRIPVPSSAHDLLSVRVRGANGLGTGGTVRVYSTVGTVTLTFDGPVGVEEVSTSSLDVDTTAAYDDITVELDTGGASDTVRLLQIDMDYAETAAPLAAGVVSRVGGTYTLEPLDVAEFVANDPLPAAAGRIFGDNLRHLRERPMSVPLCWGGVDVAALDVGYETHGPHSHRAPVIVRPGALIAGRTYTVWALVEGNGATAEQVVISATPARDWPRPYSADDVHTAVISVASGDARQWKTTTLQVPVPPAGAGHPGLPYASCDLGVTLSPEHGAASTGALLYAISAWG